MRITKSTFTHQRLTTLLILIPVVLLSFQVRAQEALSKKIAITVRDVSPKKALQEIQKASGTRILFGEDINLFAGNKVTISDNSITVKQALDLTLENTKLTYEEMAGSILIKEKPATSSKSPNPSAGGDPGSIKGRVVDFETSQPLPGATVFLVELKKGMTADANGYYRFDNIPAGTYTLQVSFIGYSLNKQQVTIRDRREVSYDVRLSAGNNLGEVVVSSSKISRGPVSHTSEKQVLEIIKNSQSVVSGISSEEIGKSADRNAAEVVEKIAGVTVKDNKFVIVRGLNERYNLTYLNGNVAPSTELYSRAFDLSLIPTRIIDRILVYKSPAPDLLADMTGGAVKIFTKDAKDVKHFDIEVQSGYRENTTFNNNFLIYQGSKLDFLGFNDGSRKLPSSVPGYGDFTKANISQKTYAKTFSNILTYRKKKALPPAQVTANYYNSFKVAGHSLSMLSSLSYKNEPQHMDIDRTQGYLAVSDIGPHLSKMSSESQNNETAQLSLLQNFTYHLKDSSNIFFKNFLLQQGQNSTILRNTNTNQVYSDGKWQDMGGGSTPQKRLRDIILSWSQRFLYSGNIGGSHYFGRSKKQQLEWNAGYTYSRLDIPDQRAIHLQNSLYNDPRFPSGGDFEQNWVPAFRSEQNDNNNVDLGMISRVWIRNTEQTYNGSADYTYKILPWIILKAGTYQQWKQRIVFRRVYTLNEGDLPASGYPDLFKSAIGSLVPYMDYNLIFWRQQDLPNVWSTKYLRDDGSALKVFDRTTGADAYTATEQNNSAYAAFSLLPFKGKLDIYGGLRIEYDRQKIAGALSPTGVGLQTGAGTNTVNIPAFADNKSTELLPSLNIGYRPSNSLVLRAAYGKTVNRPELRELSPYSELDYQNNQRVMGNTSLVSATVENYDVRLEWYPQANSKGETISIGGFYKDLSLPIERVLYRDYNIPGFPPTISFLNADKAAIKGLELDIRKSLDFIPGAFFRDLSVIANGSLIYSKVTRSKVDTTSRNSYYDAGIDRQLQGQSPYILNAGLYYENAGSGTKAAILYNEIGPRIYAASVGQAAGTVGYDPGSQGSLLELKRRQLDFSVTQRLVKSLQLKFSIQNLLNDRVQMAEDANFTYKYEKAVFVPNERPGQTDVLQGDLLASDYASGRFYLVTLTYGF